MSAKNKVEKALKTEITPFWILMFVLTLGLGVFFYKNYKTSEIIEQIPVNDLDDPDLNERQKRIILLLKRKSEITMPDITMDIPKVTTRTLRRDMTKLVDMGLVKQIGNTRDTKYKLVKKL